MWDAERRAHADVLELSDDPRRRRREAAGPGAEFVKPDGAELVDVVLAQRAVV